jgi:hypothetical protein
MTAEQHSAIYSLIAIGIPIVIILAIAILYHVTAKKAHEQNMKDIDERYEMPKK